MARREFGGDAKTCPVIHTNAKVCGTQHNETEAGCVPENELECACCQLRRLRQQSRGGHDVCGIEQLSGWTGVASVGPSSNQNFAGCQQSRKMVTTPTNHWEGWRPFCSDRIVQFRGGRKNATKI